MNFNTIADLDQIYETQTLKNLLGVTNDTCVEFSTKNGEIMLVICEHEYTVKKFRGSLWLVTENAEE